MAAVVKAQEGALLLLRQRLQIERLAALHAAQQAGAEQEARRLCTGAAGWGPGGRLGMGMAGAGAAGAGGRRVLVVRDPLVWSCEVLGLLLPQWGRCHAAVDCE